MTTSFPNPTFKDGSTVVFIESRPGVESLFTRLLRHGARRAGWKHRVVSLRNEQGRRIHDSELAAIIASGPADLIAFLMDAPLSSPGVWKTPDLHAIPKISLWYDDFTRSAETLSHPEVWRHWQADDHVSTFIWDGYWRQRWHGFSGHNAYPIHLSADPEQLFPDTVSLFPELTGYAVFTGTIPSIKALQEDSTALPSPIRNYFNNCIEDLKVAPWPIRAYDIALQEHAALSDKLAAVVNQWLSNPAHKALFNEQLWRWAKRIARLRGLQAVMQSGPVAVLSGHRTARFAGEDELRRELQAPDSFIFRNTTNVPHDQWSAIFRCGRFQLQFTDPQSIAGGIPFRVFECAASAMPLLSDTRPELAEEFINNEEIILATDEADLTRRSHDLFTADHDILLSIGAAALDKFRQKHTCTVRWREIISSLAHPPEPTDVSSSYTDATSEIRT